MTLRNKILFTILSILCSQAAKTQDTLQLWYPYQINVLPNCSVKSFERSVPITTNSKSVVKLYSLKTNSNEYILLYNGKEVQEEDTVSLTGTKPAIFTVKFETMPKNQDSLYFSFKTNTSKEIFKKGQIKLLFKEYNIARNEISSEKVQTVELSQSCLDSINVYFPFGGTETHISLYDPQNLQKPIKSIWYQLFSNTNYMTFSRKDIGRYFVTLSSCWSGTEFWLTIK